MLQLFGHAFSSYTWKALIALYESATRFEFRSIDPDHPANWAELVRLSPLGKFPLLVDGEHVVFEATSVIEHLAVFHPGVIALLPADRTRAIEVRMLDRLFDNYVMAPMQKLVGDALRPDDARDPFGADEARTTLDRIYAWLDERMADRDWAATDFSLADCAAAPALFYADWAHSIEHRYRHLKAYRARLLARPSVGRVVDEARPYRPFFPLGAPDRD